MMGSGGRVAPMGSGHASSCGRPRFSSLGVAPERALRLPALAAPATSCHCRNASCVTRSGAMHAQVGLCTSTCSGRWLWALLTLPLRVCVFHLRSPGLLLKKLVGAA